MMRQLMAPSSSSGALSSQSYSAAVLFGLGNKRGSLLSSLLPTTTRRRLATAAGWRDRSTAAFSFTSLSVPSSTELIRKKKYYDNYQFQCNNNFFSTTTTTVTNRALSSLSSVRSTAMYATVPKADEKHVVKKTSKQPNNKTVIYDYTTIHNNPLPPNYQLKSKPKQTSDDSGGNWDPTSPLKWCQTFGSRSPSMQQHLSTLIQLKPGDEGYIPPETYNQEEYPTDVTVVRTKEQARVVLEALRKSKLTEPERIHACDTEVMDIDLSNVGPVGNGYVTCLSVYSGPDFDYGLNDQGPGTMLWVDNLDDACGILDEFKEWLEDEMVMKVWHNYGFDRHVLWNEGIDVLGFGGDTTLSVLFVQKCYMLNIVLDIINLLFVD
eukprot:scaffold23907_cov154-Skeletonema_menzelii.AAC.1